jgi:hypothetical protein
MNNKPILEIFNPRKLLFSDRLDIACKYLFFEELENPTPDDFIINLYTKHIFERTQGCEKKDKMIPYQIKKKKIKDYIKHAKELYNSMKKNGFKKKFPVPYYENGITNGAHRIACALCLNIDIAAIKVTCFSKKTWDENWFIEKKFSYNEIKLLKTTLEKLKNENSFIQ